MMDATYAPGQAEDVTYSHQNHHNVNHTDYPRSTLTTIILPTIFFVVFVVGFIGNTMAVYVIGRMRSSKKIADLFMVNLAIADLIFLGTLPFWASEYAMNGNWVFGRAFCKLTSTFTLFSSYGSVFFLSLMAVDRLGVVVFYKRYNHYRSVKKAVGLILILWCAAVVTSLVATFFRDTYFDHETGHTHCRWFFDESQQSHRVWYCTHFILRFIVGFAVPLVITFVCYIVIFIYLRDRRSKKKLLRKKQDRVTLTVMVVVVAFIVCWMPNQISNFVYVAQGLGILAQPDPPSAVQYYVHLFTNSLAWSHSCFNPFVYASMREDVRHKFFEITRGNCAHSETRYNIHRSSKTFTLQLTKQTLKHGSDKNQAKEQGSTRPPVLSASVPASPRQVTQASRLLTTPSVQPRDELLTMLKTSTV